MMSWGCSTFLMTSKSNFLALVVFKDMYFTCQWVKTYNTNRPRPRDLDIAWKIAIYQIIEKYNILVRKIS